MATESPGASGRRATRAARWPILTVVAGATVSAALTAAAAFGDDAGGGARTWLGWLLTLAGILVAASLVYAFAVFWGLQRPRAPVGWGAVILAVLATASLAVFRAGLPAVLAAGAVLLAAEDLRRRRTRRRVGPAVVAIVVAAGAVVAAAWLGLGR